MHMKDTIRKYIKLANTDIRHQNGTEDTSCCCVIIASGSSYSPFNVYSDHISSHLALSGSHFLSAGKGRGKYADVMPVLASLAPHKMYSGVTKL